MDDLHPQFCEASWANWTKLDTSTEEIGSQMKCIMTKLPQETKKKP